MADCNFHDVYFLTEPAREVSVDTDATLYERTESSSLFKNVKIYQVSYQ